MFGLNRCKFWKKCKLYNRWDRTCNEDGGMYYDEGINERPPGCYREMEKNENK